MSENVLYQHQKIIHLDKPCDEQIKDALIYDKMYSFLIYAKCDEIGILDNFVIKIMISQNEKYNTITKAFASNYILDSINAYRDYVGKTKVIGYKQPPLEYMIELYEPLMGKMCAKMQMHWTHYEYDDLLQICRICMIELYNKGYYIHKNLLWTAFKNEILMQVRPLKNQISIISIYNKCNDLDPDDKELCLLDTLVDEADVISEEEQEIHEANLRIFEEVKDIIIELVGPRQFDMLFRDYAKKHTTAQSRKLLLKIKSHLNSLGVTLDRLNDRYR